MWRPDRPIKGLASRLIPVSTIGMPLKFSEFPIFKASATGNDFLLIDLLNENFRRQWQHQFDSRPRGEWTREWCDRHQGLGADGLVILEPTPQADFKWDFYNSDGGGAEMCGNAARAVSLYVHLTHGKKRLTFLTRAGAVNATIHGPGDIEAELPAVSEAQWDQNASGTNYSFIRAGVPHAVISVPRLEPITGLLETAMKIKCESRFAKSGVNVTFVQNLTSDKIRSITFERGVEDFTLSCGTGAVAAAYSVVRGRENTPIEVQVPGGTLNVLWKNTRPHLRGPARVHAEMHVMERKSI